MNGFFYTVLFLISMICIGSIFLCGFFDVTRGSEETLPDGKTKRNGKLFKGWYFFWFKKSPEPLTIFFAGSEFDKLYKNLVREFAMNGYSLNGIVKNDGYIIIPGDLDVIILVNFCDKLKCKFISGANSKDGIDIPNQHIIRFYKEYPDYYYPEWIRDMMAGCITCSATVYGNIFFWLVYAIANNSILFSTMFSWGDNYYLVLIGVWLSYYVGVSFVSTFLYKRFNR